MKYLCLVLLAVILVSSLSLTSCRLAYRAGQESASQSDAPNMQQQAQDAPAGAPAPSNPQSGSSSPQVGTATNKPPQARIISITPTTAYQGDKITFKGEGTDTDGIVKAYLWKSSIDSVISRDASFSTDILSEGTHIITFQVIDNGHAKSKEVDMKVVIHQLTQAPAVPPTGNINNPNIFWRDPNQIIFSFTSSNLNPSYEYWVYPYVEFYNEGKNLGSSPEVEANNLTSNHDVAITKFLPAKDNGGTYYWYSSRKPLIPQGTLVLLAYDPIIKKGYVVDISEQINDLHW